MKILPSSPIARFVETVELDGATVNPTYIDMATGHIQYWKEGLRVEATGEVRVLLKSHQERASLEATLSLELDRLLEETKRRLAVMSPEDREREYQAQKESFARAMSTPCEHGELDFEQCEQCRAQPDRTEELS